MLDLMTPNFEAAGSMSCVPLKDRIDKNYYSMPEKFRATYPSYYSSWVTVDDEVNESVVVWSFNYAVDLTVPARLNRVQRCMRQIMLDAVSDTKSVPFVYGVCFVGVKVAFYTMERNTKQFFNEHGQEIMKGISYNC